MKNLVFRKRKGGALVMVMIVMVVMTILGTTILTISLAENKQAIREKNRIEAYYLARSGVEATAAWVLESDRKSEEVDKIINKTSDLENFGNGKFNVEVLEDNETKSLILIGTGTVNGVSSNSRLVIEKSSNAISDLTFEHVLYAGNSLNLSGHIAIDGSIGYGGSDVKLDLNGKHADNLKGNIYPMDTNYPLPKFPKADEIKTTENPTEILFTGAIKTIEFSNGINSNNNLDIYTGVGAGSVNIVVNGNFNFGNNGNSKLVIHGDKRVNIYVKDNINLRAEINSEGNSQQLLFLMDNTGSINLNTNGVKKSMRGFIYAPSATFQSSGNAMMEGAVIVSEALLSGTPFVTGAGAFNPADGNIDIPLPKLYSRGTWLN